MLEASVQIASTLHRNDLGFFLKKKSFLTSDHLSSFMIKLFCWLTTACPGRLHPIIKDLQSNKGNTVKQTTFSSELGGTGIAERFSLPHVRTYWTLCVVAW